MTHQAPEPRNGIHSSEVIAMAWDDETSFDAIKNLTGLSEKDVILLMRENMKPSSFRMWRKRVSGRKSKHESRKNPLVLNDDPLPL